MVLALVRGSGKGHQVSGVLVSYFDTMLKMVTPVVVESELRGPCILAATGPNRQ